MSSHRVRYVVQTYLKSLVLFADDIRDRHLHIIESHKGRAAWMHALTVHAPGVYSGHGFFHQQHADPAHPRAAGSGRDGKKIRKNTISDPLLLAVEHEMAAVRRFFRAGFDVSDVGAGRVIWLATISVMS